MATASLENSPEAAEYPYKKIPGEAAFYGPKIDIKLIDAIGRRGSSPPCSSTSTCRSASGSSTSAKTATATSRDGAPRALGSVERSSAC